jgi:2,3-bisphosphoglycerate-independent phosphoglycerate mutase
VSPSLERPRRVVFVFVDGVGLGTPDGAINPLAATPLPALEALASGQPWTGTSRVVRGPDSLFQRIDATLGVAGLPQSGTGQASLLTGVNCAAVAGRHWGPYPHSTSRPAIDELNLFTRLARAGRSSQFLNAYPDPFFRVAAQRDRWTVTTRCCLAAGLPLRREDDLRGGRAVAADLTAEGWRLHLGLDVPTITPREAGRRVAGLSENAHLTLFEYYLTDKAGHARDLVLARKVLSDLDAFIAGIRDQLPPDALLVLTSDHGNIEDLTVRTHTLHPVPLAARGPGAEALAAARNLTDVTPILVDLLR